MAHHEHGTEGGAGGDAGRVGHHIEEMLSAHPLKPAVDKSTLAAGIHAIDHCAQACTACADACLAEERRAELVRCIRLNLDCADICGATADVLSRQAGPDWGVVGRQLEACQAAAKSCAEECERHAGHHEHCRICATNCRECGEAAGRLRKALPL